MSVNILTQEDLQKFKTELFVELKTLFNQSAPGPQKKYSINFQIVFN